MDKALAVTAAATAFLTAILVIIGSGEFLYALPAVGTLVLAILAFFRRDGEAVAAGIGLTLVGLAGLLMLMQGITFRGGADVDTNMANYVAWAAAATAGLVGVAVASWLVRLRMESWGPVTAIAASAVSILFLWILPGQTGEYMGWTSWISAVAAVVAGVPALMALRGDLSTHADTQRTRA